MEDTPNIRKIEEFEAFLDTLEGGSSAHWCEIAEVLNVDKDTITEWKKHPRAIEARSKGIQYALAQMEMAGKNDWRMWVEKLKMLGINKDSKKDTDIIDAEELKSGRETASLMLKIYAKMHENESETLSQIDPNFS